MIFFSFYLLNIQRYRWKACKTELLLMLNSYRMTERLEKHIKNDSNDTSIEKNKQIIDQVNRGNNSSIDRLMRFYLRKRCRFERFVPFNPHP